jgi:hypothetical protein
VSDEIPWPIIAARFLRSVAVLALPAAAQVDWLRSLGLGEPGLADELALEFDDGFGMLAGLMAQGVVPDAATPILLQIDSLLSTMSEGSQPEVWEVEALSSAPQWEEVRELAQRVLSLMP